MLPWGGSIGCEAPQVFDSLHGSFEHRQAAEKKPMNVVLTTN
jgi:hypothetical protein